MIAYTQTSHCFTHSLTHSLAQQRQNIPRPLSTYILGLRLVRRVGQRDLVLLQLEDALVDRVTHQESARVTMQK